MTTKALSTKLISTDTADFAANLQVALLQGGFSCGDWQEDTEPAEPAGPTLYLVDGRALATEPAGAQIPRPEGVPEGAAVLLWVPAPLRLQAQVPWAGGFVQAARSLLLALRDEHYLAQFRAEAS